MRNIQTSLVCSAVILVSVAGLSASSTTAPAQVVPVAEAAAKEQTINLAVTGMT